MKINFIFILLLLVVSCKKNKTTWNTEWDVPLVHDSLTLSQLVDDSMIVSNLGVYEFSFDRELFQLKLSDFVQIPDTSVDHIYSFPINLNVNPGFSFVNDVQEHVIDLDDVELKKIKVKAGGVFLKVYNPIETKTFFTVELPGVTKNGLTLSKTFTAAAGTISNPTVTQTYVDLSGYDIDLRGANSLNFNRIQSKLVVQSDPAGPAVNVTTSTAFKFNFTMQNITLSYARGYFGQFSETKTEEFNLEALDKIESGLIDIDAADLELKVENGLKVNARFKLTSLKNTNAQLSEVNLTHPIVNQWQSITSASGSSSSTLNPSVNIYEFNGSNSNLEAILENHGAKNELGYSIQLNPWGNTSGGWDEVYDEHPFTVSLKGTLPMKFGCDNLILKDTFAINIVQDKEKTHVESGMFVLNATNAFPMNANVQLVLLDQNKFLLGAINGSQLVESSIYGTVVNGIQQMKSKVLFEIPSNLVDELNNAKFITVRVTLNTPDASGNAIQYDIPIDGFFKFTLNAKLNIKASV
ncbi:MAG: hypothetical protein ACK479_06415 [Fluviicola sp.]